MANASGQNGNEAIPLLDGDIRDKESSLFAQSLHRASCYHYMIQNELESQISCVKKAQMERKRRVEQGDFVILYLCQHPAML